MTGRVVHDSFCSTPLTEHNGMESCLRWVEDEAPAIRIPAHYAQGPQGNQVCDFKADFFDRYGEKTGPIISTMKDKRDNRDPAAVGEEFLSRRAIAGNGHTP